MQLECDDKGDLFIDPDFLSVRFGLSPQELRRRMRIGLVTSLVEAGTGADEGQRRITVRCGRSAWRAIVDPCNTITSEEFLNLGMASRPCDAA